MADGPATSDHRSDLLVKARDAFERQAWAEAYADFSAADKESPLTPADVMSLAIAARLLGFEEEVDVLLGRAHRDFLADGDIPQAVRCAFWLCMNLFKRGAFGPAGGWLTRAHALLEDSRLDCVEHGYVLLPTALKTLGEGDSASAYAAFQQVAKIAERFEDSDLLALSRLGRGVALIQLGEILDASGQFDEAMVAVTIGEVSSLVAGIVFCGVIEACSRIFDLGRAHEWTTALSNWCESQPDMVLYRGQCLVYRAEILQLRGAWQDALKEAQLACDRLSAPLRVPEAGEAFYRLGELHRIKGQFSKAEDAYRRANKLGREPQPGMALLRLAEGKSALAEAAIKRVVAEVSERTARCKALFAQAEISLAVGDLKTGRAAMEELGQIGPEFHSPLLEGMTAHARGAVLLAEGDPQGALDFLRRAAKVWQHLEMPYEAAKERVLIALACRQLGDEDSAELELNEARWVFEDLGAVPDVEAVHKLFGKASRKPPGRLTLREVQVLRLVAGGKTNRAAADTLFISEKTVDRHLSNIFVKLGVSSRAAATASGYEQGIL